MQLVKKEKLFAYRARDHDGRGMDGLIRAESERAAARYICGQGYYVTAIQEQKSKSRWRQYLAELQGIPPREIMIFCRQLAIMIQAGLPLIAALKILREQSRQLVLKEVLADIYQQVKRGESLTNALRPWQKFFPPIVIYMVEAGEVGGILDEVLNRLALHLEKDYQLKEKVKSALAYPIAVIVLAFIVVLILLTFVIPIFVTIFDHTAMELPLPTRILLEFSTVWGSYGLPLLLVLAGLGLILSKLYDLPKYRINIDRIMLKLPLVGSLRMKIAVARFTRTLGALLNGGVPLTEALHVVKNVMGNRFLAQAAGRGRQGIQDGLTLSDALALQAVFEPMVIQMIAVGEETGQLALLLHKIADFYEADIDDVVARLSSLLEPVLIVILGIVVGGIVIAIAMPMFDSVTQAIQ